MSFLYLVSFRGCLDRVKWMVFIRIQDILSFSNQKKTWFHPSINYNESIQWTRLMQLNIIATYQMVLWRGKRRNTILPVFCYFTIVLHTHSSVPVLPNCGLNSGPNRSCYSSSFTSSVLWERKCMCVLRIVSVKKSFLKKITYFSIAFSTLFRYYCSKSTCQGI